MDPSPHRRNRMDCMTDYKIYDALDLQACLASFCCPLPDDLRNLPSLYPKADGLSDEQLKPEYDAMLSDGGPSRLEVVYYPPGHPERRFLEKMRKRLDDDDEYDRRVAKMRKYQHEDQPDQHDGAATKVVLLTQMLSSDDHIEDEDFYHDFLQDVTNSARKYGNLVRVVIPRPSSGGAPEVVGVGRVFLEYSLLEGSASCRRNMHRGCWGDKRIVAVFYPEDKFAAGDYGYDGGDYP
ncbi:hypothetical protein CFC21_073199 [Triticum aestivum]|uniref:RRM domain-containing protein n=2 Tax=Triticum aestivum TaxID=4565 RepID=A0A3B6LQT0_WHEAT|nr:uncharacterized protein LOC123116836 isoform X2 [Triticum aestivum]KAF7067292.1 hypothetical protein CFC21_073199 [Triticum aestivum]